MKLQLYNSLTRRKEDFKPLKGNTVSIYSCGPTVYDYPHIGNYRAFLFVDLLKRYLLFLGYDVRHVMNITDVDDKIIKRCMAEGISQVELSGEYKNAFFEDTEILGMLAADEYPAATEHIPEMQELVQTLIEKGHAYVTSDGSVFFKISSFPGYGALSRTDVSGLSRTERVVSDEYEKQGAADFALWKGWKEEDGDTFWDSPWGRGRPGWHIECSAMSMKYLGEEFDIHCGGVDLVFPHHENEIAQSVCATGKRFVNFWIHCEHLLVDGARMSKSLGNYYTVPDLIKKGFSPSAIRYFLETTHYRRKVNLTFDGLWAAESAVERLSDLRRRLERIVEQSECQEAAPNPKLVGEFSSAMNDDLNISVAMAVVFNWVRDVNRGIDRDEIAEEEAAKALSFLREIDSVLGVVFGEGTELSEEDRQLIGEREEARQNEEWERADEIREYFFRKGIRLEDGPAGTVVKRVARKDRL